MTIAILALLAAIIPFAIKEFLRWQAKSDSPDEQAKRRREEIDREIATNNESAANESLADDLDRLHALQSHKPGPSGPPSSSRN